MAKSFIIIFFLILSEWSHAGTVINLIPKVRVLTNTTRLEHLTQMLQSDSSKLGGKFPLFAGHAIGNGQYFAKIKVGTPEQELLMVIDTESDLTWMNCKTDRDENETTPFFHPKYSSSFSVLTCESAKCREVAKQNIFKMDNCITALNDTCAFSYSYERGYVAGDLANEIVTFEGTTTTTQLQVLVTCTADYSRGSLGLDNIIYNASGILGLGINSNLRDEASSGSSNFSYCLVDFESTMNVSSYLIFGSRQGVNITLDEPMNYTELIPNAGHGLYYGVNIEDVYVNGTWVNMTTKPLKFDSEGKGGVVVDSGAMGTYFVKDAYKPIMAAINTLFAGFESDKNGPFEFCYNTAGRVDEIPEPKLEFVFANGARFAPHPESYVLRIDKNTTCLGFNDAKWNSYSVIGNTLQERYFWEFDIHNKKLGFASSSCLVN